jgi:hypothetical protein
LSGAHRSRAGWRSGLVCLLLVATAGAVRGHELGGGEVHAAVMADGGLLVEIPVEPAIVLQRLELAAGLPLTVAPTAEQVRVGVAALAAQVGASVVVELDGRPVVPAVAFAGDATTGALRLTARLPTLPQRLRFAQSLLRSRYALRVETAGEPVVVWLEPGELSAPVALAAAAAPPWWRTAGRYVALGFTHILPRGLDHVLFVLGIFLLGARLAPLLLQVTAFTVAHSLTLALAALGVVSLPAAVVEPLIALSIVYVALENVGGGDLRRSRLAVVFACGLLHGLGFAGVLQEVGLPRAQLGAALLGFNLGVELGQLAVIGLAFAAVASWGRRHAWYRRRVVVPASLAIAGAGLFWTVQRIWGAVTGL